MQGRFADRLDDAIARAGSPACVGIDPVYERLPRVVRERAAGKVDAVLRFSMAVVEAAAEAAAVVKLQSACFERYGHEGMAALERVSLEARRRGVVVILDAKRGDIGLTSEHYAAWAFDAVGADAVTLQPYLGEDAIAPFLHERWSRDRGRGVFVLVRTSNPSGDELQRAALAEGGTVALRVAAMVRRLGEERLGRGGLSDVGAVVAATKPAEQKALREAMPQQWLLVPGYGAQGGDAASVRDCFLPDGRGAIVSASRSVLYSFDPDEARWSASVQAAAQRLANDAALAAREAARRG